MTRLSVHQDLSTDALLKSSRQNVEQSRLSSTRRAQDCEELAGANATVKVTEDAAFISGRREGSLERERLLCRRRWLWFGFDLDIIAQVLPLEKNRLTWRRKQLLDLLRSKTGVAFLLLMKGYGEIVFALNVVALIQWSNCHEK